MRWTRLLQWWAFSPYSNRLLLSFCPEISLISIFYLPETRQIAPSVASRKQPASKLRLQIIHRTGYIRLIIAKKFCRFRKIFTQSHIIKGFIIIKIHSVNSSLTFKPCLMLYCFDLFSLNLLITQSIKQNFKTDNTFFRQLPKQMYSIQCTDEIQFIFLFTFVYKYCIIKLNLLGVLNC